MILHQSMKSLPTRKKQYRLKQYINKDTIVYLAADEDREGEAIAWL